MIGSRIPNKLLTTDFEKKEIIFKLATSIQQSS